jgi:hypothetical protein
MMVKELFAMVGLEKLTKVVVKKELLRFELDKLPLVKKMNS